MEKSIVLIAALFYISCSAGQGVNITEQKFLQAGLVDIKKYDSSIQVDLVNSDSGKNFFRKNFYSSLKTCYVQDETAQKAAKAQHELKRINSSYSLLIYDGARPGSVSRLMYEQFRGSPLQVYVADPEHGSMHNYGAAVDAVIVDKNGRELDMGPNPFRKNNIELVKLLIDIKSKKKLTAQQKENRLLLKKVMTKAGFRPISLEWWHFNINSKDYIRKRYKIIE